MTKSQRQKRSEAYRTREAANALTDYIRRAGQRYASGYIPTAEESERESREIVTEARERTLKILDALAYGPHNRFAMVKAMTGFKDLAVREILTGQSTNPNRNHASRRYDATAPRLRTLQLALLATITGIREELHDFERELWIALQLTHDPSITRTEAAIKKLHKANLAKSRKLGKPRKPERERASDRPKTWREQREQMAIVLPPRLMSQTPEPGETPAAPGRLTPRDGSAMSTINSILNRSP